jgi:hypothetical protein
MAVVDPPSAHNYVNTDSMDRNLLRSAFLLLSLHDSNGDYLDWSARRLSFDGYTLRIEAIRNRQVTYLVER